MRFVSAIVLVCVMGGVATAQPGTTQPAQPYPPPPPPQPQPYPAPQPQPYPSYAPPQPQYHLLTEEERELIARGEIDSGQHIAGGAVGTFVGLGIGHAIQGRWSDKGWIFTVGEIASFGLILVSLGDCGFEENCEDEFDQAWFGLVALIGFRVWEVFDVWLGPPSHNRKVRAAQSKAYGYGYPPPGYGVYLAPPLTRDPGGVAGVTLRF